MINSWKSWPPPAEVALPRECPETKPGNDLASNLGETRPLDPQGISESPPKPQTDATQGNAVPDGPRNGAKNELAVENRQGDGYAKPAKNASASPWASLPFVGKGTDRPLNFWQTQPGDDGEDDCRRGADYAALAIAAARANAAPFLIGWIMADMIEAGRAGQLELAFVHAIAGELPR